MGGSARPGGSRIDAKVTGERVTGGFGTVAKGAGARSHGERGRGGADHPQCRRVHDELIDGLLADLGPAPVSRGHPRPSGRRQRHEEQVVPGHADPQ